MPEGDGPGADRDEDVHSNAQLLQAVGGGLRWIIQARLVIELVLFGSLVVLARLIPPAEFGIFAITIIVQEIALTMPMEGVGSALVQRPSVQRAHLQGGMALSLVLGALLAATTLGLAVVVVGPLYGERAAALMVLTVPWCLLGSIYAVPVAILRRRLDFARLSVIDIALNVTRAAVAVGLAFAGLDAEALILGSLAGMIAAVVLAIAFAPPPLPGWRPQAMRELLGFGGPAALATIAWTGFRNGDYAIIAARLGTAQAGLYWRSYQLSVEYQRKISVAMTQMAFPVFSRAEGPDAMLVLRHRMVRLLTVVLFPLLASLALLAPVLVPWAFGPSWEPAVLPTQILAIGGAAVLVTDAAGAAIMAAGRSRALLGYGVAHFAVYAAVVVVAASKGLAAVAIGAALVHTVFLVIAYKVMLRGSWLSALGELWRDVSAATLGCLALATVALPTEWALTAMDAPVLVHLTVVGAAGAMTYLAALRTWFAPASADLGAALRRIVPARLVPAPPAPAL